MMRAFVCPLALLLLASCGGDPIEAGDAAGAPGAKNKLAHTPVVHEIKISDALTTMRQHPDFTIFADLVRRAGLAGRVGGKAPITVFAPADSAFDKLTAERRAALIDPAQRAALVQFVSAHILIGRASARDLSEAIAKGQGTARFKTLAGRPLALSRTDLNTAEAPPASEPDVAEAVPSRATDMLEVSEEGGGSSLVTATDIEATNGVIHVLESVLVP